MKKKEKETLKSQFQISLSNTASNALGKSGRGFTELSVN